MPLKQANRNLSIGTPLGPDVLALRSFSYTEQLGRLFQLEASVLSEKADIDFDKIVGKNVTLRLEDDARSPRFFNGFVSRFFQDCGDGSDACYRLTIVPWLWFLTRAADCRIFQQKTVPDIIKQVFRDQGFSEFRDALTGNHAAWDYCVQYRETNFNFVSRLMEQEGIYYFWEHDNSKHTLVLADSPSAHKPKSGYDKIPFRGNEAGGIKGGGGDCIFDWSMEMEVQPGTYAINDFNFEKPRTSLLGKSEIPRKHDQAKFEMFDYPGEYEQPAEGSSFSRIRIEELQAQHFIARGQSSVRGLSAGSTFTLQDHPRRDRNKPYLLTSVSLQVTGDDMESGGGGGGGFFSSSFTAIEASQQFRPSRLTPKPLIQGPQTAMVTGPSGEEIHTDKYGRIKVIFHWDRYGKADENSSCWIRVSQAAWAGKKWGALYIPRVGQEVIVEFLEGDPDLPIVTGRVYNADAMPPYDLPAEKTKTTLKSNSSKGSQGFNEIRFEDKKGQEQLFLHAERNHDLRVKKDSKTFIGENFHQMIKKDQFESTTGDKHLTVNGEHNEKVGESISIQAGQNIQEKCGMRYALQAGQEVHIKGGMNVVIEAGMSITLKAGGGFITVGPAGVAISGTPVLINSGGAAGSGSGSAPTAPKPAIEADKAIPGQNTELMARTPRRQKPTTYGPTAATLKQAAKNGTPFCEQCAKAAAAGA